MKILIETIPHSEQRYATGGDWFFDAQGDLTIRISETGDWRYSALLAVHELTEVLICKHRGISQQAVDSFDLKYEQERINGRHGPDDEPGDDPSAPYRKEHCTATGIERILASELDVCWNDYAEAYGKLFEA